MSAMFPTRGHWQTVAINGRGSLASDYSPALFSAVLSFFPFSVSLFLSVTLLFLLIWSKYCDLYRLLAEIYTLVLLNFFCCEVNSCGAGYVAYMGMPFFCSFFFLMNLSFSHNIILIYNATVVDTLCTNGNTMVKVVKTCFCLPKTARGRRSAHYIASKCTVVY